MFDGSRFVSVGRDAEPALVASDDRVLTYQALREHCSILRVRFGVGKKLVLIIARNDPDTVICYTAALNAGHTVILVGPELTGLIDFICEHYNPNFICSLKHSEWCVVKRHEVQLQLHPELACLLSTSGTTGEGKFVRLSFRNLVCNALSIAEYLSIEERDRFLLNLPINYSYGLSILNSHFAVGSCLLLTDQSVTDSELWQFFRGNGGTGFAGVPHTYKLLEASKFEDLDLPSLKTITQAGGRLPEPLARKFANWAAERGIRFFIMYGQTEASPRISYLPPSLAAIYPDCIGRAIPGGVLELVDPNGMVITENETQGELHYKGPNVMMGYATSLSDLSLGSGPSVLKTGDLAVRNSAGLFRITGRQKRFLKIYGLRISLDEVERKLEACSIKALCGGNDELLGVMTIEDKVTDQFLTDQVSRLSGLPPAVIVLVRVSDFPVLASGKVNYQSASRELLKAQAAIAHKRIADADLASINSPTGLPSSIERIFRENFPGKAIGEVNSFVSLGGDSLSYVAVAFALEDLIPRLPAHWERLTVRELGLLAAQSGADLDGGRPFWSALEALVLFRALGILLVVLDHTHTFYLNGTSILFVISGISFGKFMYPRLLATGNPDGVFRFIAKFAIPAGLWQILRIGYSGQVWLPDIFLLGTMFQNPSGGHITFWYLDILAANTLLLTILALLQRRLLGASAERGYFVMGLWWTGLGLLLSFAQVASGFWNGELGVSSVAPFKWLWMLALGVAISQVGQSSQRLILTLFLACVGLGDWLAPVSIGGSFEQSDISFYVAVLMLIWFERIPFPRVLQSTVVVIASASLFIYIVNYSAIIHLMPLLHLPAWWPLEVAVATAVGIGVSTAWNGVTQFITSRIRLAYPSSTVKGASD